MRRSRPVSTKSWKMFHMSSQLYSARIETQFIELRYLPSSALLWCCGLRVQNEKTPEVVYNARASLSTISRAWRCFLLELILVPRALLTRGATRGSGQIHIRTGIWLASSNTGYCFLTMFSWYPVMDLARAPRRAARKKGSGYENGWNFNTLFKLKLS
jgi:hypothetical protein